MSAIDVEHISEAILAFPIYRIIVGKKGVQSARKEILKSELISNK